MPDINNCNSLLGGGTNALDGIDGDLLSDGDKTVVVGASKVSFHHVNASSGAAENSPAIIAPDTNPGNKRHELLGAILASLEFADGNTVSGVSTDTTLAGDSSSELVVESAVKGYVDSQLGASVVGFVNRATFNTVKSGSGFDLKIGACAYHLSGASSRIVSSTSDITFVFGPGGSNADSTALTADTWFYVYLDDTALTANSDVMAASTFVANTTEPTWNGTKNGWYNGNDRCIFAAITDSSSYVEEIYNDSLDFVQYAESFNDRAAAAASTTFADVVLTVPSFCGKANCDMWLQRGAVDAVLQYKKKGADTSAGLDIMQIASTAPSGAWKQMIMQCFTDSSQTIQIKLTAGTNSVYIDTNGWYFPKGM